MSHRLPTITEDGWTIATYAAHNEALREAESKFQNERDRRYLEVEAEKDRALQIKEEANKIALQLARDIQTYKDMKANELREQINSERGSYATKRDLSMEIDKIETMLEPMSRYIDTVQGKGSAYSSGWNWLVGLALLIVSLIAIGSFVFHSPASTQQPQVIIMPAPINAPPTQTTTTTIPAIR